MFNRIALLTLAVGCIPLSAQINRKDPMKISVCVNTIEAYGSHVRFTGEEHLKILLNERTSREAQDWPYREWEMAAQSINWFDGTKPVSLAYVKSHIPRAMLLELRFPVDPNPHMVKADVDRLLEAERKYNESTKIADSGRQYLADLLKKYCVGPSATFDKDMGGATPMSDCGKWEERDFPEK